MTQFIISFSLIRMVDDEPFFIDEVAEWIQNNNNSASPHIIEHKIKNNDIITRTHYRLTVMFENDIDAILFKMRWL